MVTAGLAFFSSLRLWASTPTLCVVVKMAILTERNLTAAARPSAIIERPKTLVQIIPFGITVRFSLRLEICAGLTTFRELTHFAPPRRAWVN
jgi:hypothetical protein